MTKLFSTYWKSSERAFHVGQWSTEKWCFEQPGQCSAGRVNQESVLSKGGLQPPSWQNPVATFPCSSKAPDSVPLRCVTPVWGAWREEGTVIGKYIITGLFSLHHRQSSICLSALHSQMRPMKNLLNVNYNYQRRQSDITAMGTPEMLQAGNSLYGCQQMLILINVYVTLKCCSSASY